MSAWSPRWCPSRRSAALTLLATVLLLTVAPGRAAPPAAPDAGPAPYPADFDPFLALPTPPPWAAQATFSADAAALADRLATQDRVWARVDLRVPTPDLDRLTPAQRQAWQAALALDAAALAALRAAPQVAAVEALPPVVRAVADPPPPEIRRPDEYLVVFPPQVFSAAGRAAGQTGAEVARLAALLAAQHQGQVVHHWGHALAGVGLRLSAAAATALAADPRVAHLEPNQRLQVHAVQVAPPWGLDRSDQRALPLNQACEYTPTDADGVTVYIIDTGIRLSHADFAGRASWGANLIDDRDSDCHGHGTHVAGTVAGTTYGVAKGAHLVAVKVLDAPAAAPCGRCLAGWIGSSPSTASPPWST